MADHECDDNGTFCRGCDLDTLATASREGRASKSRPTLPSQPVSSTALSGDTRTDASTVVGPDMSTR